MNSFEVLAIAFQYQKAGHLSEAEQLYRKIIQQQPEQIEVLQLLGVIAYQKGNIEEAITYYRKALTLSPNQAVIHNHLGIIFKNQNKLEEAKWHFAQAVALQPQNAQFHCQLGLIFRNQNMLEKAEEHYRQAIALQSKYAEAYENLGCVLYIQRQMEQALACFERVLALKPDHISAHLNRAGVLLTLGDYSRGFAEYEWRRRRWNLYDLANQSLILSTPYWDGSPLQAKTILLHAEQGFGDTFQFVRYASSVKERGGYVIVACPSSQVQLLKNVSGIDRVVALGSKFPAFDTHAFLMSLPYLLGTTAETIPCKIPYIFPPESHPLKLKAPQGKRLKVGIVWMGNPKNVPGLKRSCGLQTFLPVLEIPNVAFYSLQVGMQAQDLATLPPSIQVQDLSSQLLDFTDTAAVITQLDLIITIDSSVAHLAGALGKPTWVVLPFLSEWRWLLHLCDSPWYPSMRLFRQECHNDWSGVLAQVAQALHAELDILL